MQLRYFAESNSNIPNIQEVGDTPLEVIPQRHGTLASHLAYAIEAAHQRSLTTHPTSNDAAKQAFIDCMKEAPATTVFLASTKLPVNFDFIEPNLRQRLAAHFVLPSRESAQLSANATVIETTAEHSQTLVIRKKQLTDSHQQAIVPYAEPMECALLLTPLRYGIQFRGDPHWYEIAAACEWLRVSPHRNPCRGQWQTIQEIRLFPEHYAHPDCMLDYNFFIPLWETMQRIGMTGPRAMPVFDNGPEIALPDLRHVLNWTGNSAFNILQFALAHPEAIAIAIRMTTIYVAILLPRGHHETTLRIGTTMARLFDDFKRSQRSALNRGQQQPLPIAAPADANDEVDRPRINSCWEQTRGLASKLRFWASSIPSVLHTAAANIVNLGPPR